MKAAHNHNRISRWVRRVARAALVASAALGPIAAQGEEIVVTLWGTGMFGVPYAVAMDKGMFKQAGAPVTGVLAGTGGGSVIRNTLANNPPFGEVSSAAAIAAQRQGLPIVVVGHGGRSYDNVWAVMPDSPIKSIKDLVGKRVSYTNPKSISEAFLLMLLQRNGIDPNSVKRVAAGGYGQGLTLMENGGVDVAPMTEPLSTMRKGKYRIIFTAEEALPPIVSCVLITTRDYAAKNPQKVRAFIEGRRRGVDFIYQNPAEAGRIVAKAYDMPEKVGIEAVEAMAKAKQWSHGEVDLKEYKALADGLKLTGELTSDVDWGKLIDISYLPDDLRKKSVLK